MPQNNPYDKELSPRRQLISNISLVIIVMLVVSFVLWVIFSQPQNVRTKLDSLQIPLSFSENTAEENEFSEFLLTLNSPQGISPTLIDKFPAVTALLKMEEPVYAENTPYVLCEGNCVAVALSYTSTSVKNAVTMDVLLLPYHKTDGGISFDAPIRYSVSYNSSTGVIEQAELRTESYRLSFYNLAISLQTSQSVAYQIELSSVISDKEADTENLLSGIAVSPQGDSPLLTRQESSSVINGTISGADENNPAQISIAFGDAYYDYFTGLSFTVPGDVSDVTLTLD